jgi:hypothetical protein
MAGYCLLSEEGKYQSSSTRQYLATNAPDVVVFSRIFDDVEETAITAVKWYVGAATVWHLRCRESTVGLLTPNQLVRA